MGSPINCQTYKNIIQLIHTVDLGEQLIDDSVVDARVSSDGTAGLANGVYFVKDDDVQTGVGAHSFFLLLRVGKETSDVGFRFADVLVQDLGTVDNLRLSGVQHFSDLTSHQSLAGSGWSEQQDTLIKLES